MPKHQRMLLYGPRGSARASVTHRRPESCRPHVRELVVNEGGGDIDLNNNEYDDESGAIPSQTEGARKVWNAAEVCIQKLHPIAARYITSLYGTCGFEQRKHTTKCRPLSDGGLVMECGISSKYASPEHADVKDLWTFAFSLKCPSLERICECDTSACESPAVCEPCL